MGKPSNERAIEKRRNDLRGGLSVNEVCTQKWASEEALGWKQKIRNRKSWARNPDTIVSRMFE